MSSGIFGFSGVVMAGGRSTRMGRDKALLPLADGTTLLAHAAEKLRAVRAAEVIVSVPANKTYGLAGTREVADAQPDCGPIGGLAACLGAATHPLCLVLAVDLPAMPPEYLRGLLARCRCSRGVVPVMDGSFEPLAAVYPTAALARVKAAVSAGDFAMQKLIAQLASDGLVESVPVTYEQRPLFANWNSPEDCR